TGSTCTSRARRSTSTTFPERSRRRSPRLRATPADRLRSIGRRTPGRSKHVERGQQRLAHSRSAADGCGDPAAAETAREHTDRFFYYLASREEAAPLRSEERRVGKEG